MRTTGEDWAARQTQPTALQFRRGILVDDQRNSYEPTSHPSPSPIKNSRCGRPARAPGLLSVCPDGRFHLETRSEMVPNAPFAIDIRRRIPDLQQA